MKRFLRTLGLVLLGLAFVALNSAVYLAGEGAFIGPPGCTTDSDCQAKFGGNGDPD
jgi:hypothetical protein